MPTSRLAPLVSRARTAVLDAPPGAVAFVAVAAISGYRGSAASGWAMYLDEVFLEQALFPDPQRGGLRDALDPLALFRSFSGYLHVVVRAAAALLSSMPLVWWPVLVFAVTTLAWAGCGTAIAWAVRSATGSRGAGTLAAAAFALSPFANVILLGQLNALQWPMLATAAVVVGSGSRPATKRGWIALGAFIAVLSLNAALAVLIVALLAVRCVMAPRRDLGLLLAAGVPFVLQVGAYVSQAARTAVAEPATAQLGELSHALQMVVPSALRKEYGYDPSLWQTAVALAWWTVVLAAGWVLLRRAGRGTRTRAAWMLSAGSVFLVVSVVLNGGLNHQYLAVPTTCLVAAGVDAVASARRRLPSIVLVLAFLFSSVTMWPRTLHDTFFEQPPIFDWRSELHDAKRQCERPDDVVTVFRTTRPLRVPCSRL
jgi:hypothetical protein